MKKLQSIFMAAIMLLTVASLLVVPAFAANGVNLVTNGDFESTEGWSIAETHSVCAEAGKSGNGLMIDYATAGTAMTYATLNGLEAGKTYTLSFDAKIVTATQGSGLRYIIREGAGGSLVGDVTKFLPSEVSDWTTVSVLFEVAEFKSENAPQLQFYFMHPTSAGKVYIDNVSIAEKQLPPAKIGNIVENWNLENTTNNEWSLLSGAEIAALTEGEGASASTNKVLKLKGNADAQPVAYQSMTGFKANTKYNVSIDIKGDAIDTFTAAAGSDKGLRVRVDYNKRLTSAAFYPMYTSAVYTDTWKRIGVSFTTSATVTTESVLVLSLFLTDATGTIYVDDISVEEVLSDTGNLALNGSFEEAYNTGFPASWSNTGGGENPGRTIFMDNTDPYDGNWCVKFDCASNKSINTGAAAQRLCLQQRIDVTAGKTYRISYAAKVSGECSTVPMFIRQSGTATPGFLNNGTALPTANKWYEVVMYYTPTTSGYAQILIGSYSAHWGNGSFYIDNFRLEEVTEARVDFVNPTKNSNELRVIENPVANGTAVAFAGLPNSTDAVSVVTAAYAEVDGIRRLRAVSINSTVYSGSTNNAGLVKTDEFTIPADATIIKTFVLSNGKDGAITVGESKTISLVQTTVIE